MLTVDLVRARRRGDQLQLLKVEGKNRQDAVELARRYLRIAAEGVGGTRGEFVEACGAVPLPARHRKLAGGLQKLVADRCLFEQEPKTDPVALRREVFVTAAAARRRAVPSEPFERDALLAELAAAHGWHPDELERRMYADLRRAHLLLSFDAIAPQALVDAYDLAQAQAVLLRAVRVKATVTCRDPKIFRHLFAKLKFFRLLFEARRLEKGRYELVVDGPFSVFRSVTKYGLQLALVLPALRLCDRWELEADILWGKKREPLLFRQKGSKPRKKGRGSQAKAASALTGGGQSGRAAAGRSGRAGAQAHLPDEVALLLKRFEKRKTPWRASPCAEVFNLPGVGLCVPDLRFVHKNTKQKVYLEVMGYWSRKAVWDRIELVNAGLRQTMIFAVSTRLRVSEKVLEDSDAASLYVYKGALVGKIVEEKLNKLAGL